MNCLFLCAPKKYLLTRSLFRFVHVVHDQLFGRVIWRDYCDLLTTTGATSAQASKSIPWRASTSVNPRESWLSVVYGCCKFLSGIRSTTTHSGCTWKVSLIENNDKKKTVCMAWYYDYYYSKTNSGKDNTSTLAISAIWNPIKDTWPVNIFLPQVFVLQFLCNGSPHR